MGLSGNLRDFTIAQLLNLIHLAKKTGTLIVDGPNETVEISFRDGRLAYAQINQEDNNLAYVLLKAKKLSDGQYHSIQRGIAFISDKELGLLLINAGYLSQDEILTILQKHFIEIIQRLFSWVEGFFHFTNGSLPPEDRISVRLDLENLIIDSSRKMREWEQLQDEIPSMDMALKFSERPGSNLRNINLSVEEWRVVSYINPRNTIRQIANATKMNDLEIRRIIFSLLQAGLVETTRLQGTPIATTTMRVFPMADKEEQKSLVNRLIYRIRSL